MKIICQSLTILACLLVYLPSEAQNKRVIYSDNSTFEHRVSENCINFHAPANWIIKMNFNDVDIFISKPKVNAGEKFLEYVSINVVDVDTGNPKEDFTEFLKTTRAELSELVGELNMIEVKKINLDHYEAYSWIIEGYIDMENYHKAQQVFFYLGGKVYCLSYVANHEEFDDYHDIAKKIMHSVYVDVD